MFLIGFYTDWVVSAWLRRYNAPMTFKTKKLACLALSGGMDSSSLLLHLLANGFTVLAVSIDYGQKHKIELQRAQELIDYLKKHNCAVQHHLVHLEGLTELLHSSLTQGGAEVPEGHYAAENMKDTYVPNRNKIFSSIIQAAALSLAEKENSPVLISLGIHAGDHTIYPDCRQEFRDLDYQAFLSGNWGAEKVTYYTPYLEWDKFQILQDGLKSCEKLKLDFDEAYKRTLTSYKPTPEGFSDYKSASSIERIEAFIKLGRPDPLIYADETGIMSWEKVKTHAKGILET